LAQSALYQQLQVFPARHAELPWQPAQRTARRGCCCVQVDAMSSKSYHIAPIVDSTSTFLPNIFKGKVLFCTGGGSGICRAMTLAVVVFFSFFLFFHFRAELTNAIDAPWGGCGDCWSQVSCVIQLFSPRRLIAAGACG
jgi:hypothetical protein